MDPPRSAPGAHHPKHVRRSGRSPREHDRRLRRQYGARRPWREWIRWLSAA